MASKTHNDAKKKRDVHKSARDTAVDIMKSKKPNSPAWKAARNAVIRASAKVREQGDIMREETGREKGKGTSFTGPQKKATIDAIKALEASEDIYKGSRETDTDWMKANVILLNKYDGSYASKREQWKTDWENDRAGMLIKQKKEWDKDDVDPDDDDPDPDPDPDDNTTFDPAYDDYIGPGDAGGGYPFPGMELGVGFPKSSKGYLRSFPSAPEYGGDIAAESLLGYTPEWAGRDSSDWGILDPRAYGPAQQVMPWMGPLGQQPLRFAKGTKEYKPVAGDYPESGSRLGWRDWKNYENKKIIPPTATTAWKPTPYSAAEIANWQRFNQGLLAPPISFGGQTADQLAQFGLGTSGLLGSGQSMAYDPQGRQIYSRTIS